MSHDADHDLLALQAVQECLRLPRIYAGYLGGLRWSNEEDSLIDSQGRLFVFNEVIATFLDGFASAGRAIPFGCLLHWIDLFLNHRQLEIEEIRNLHSAFTQTGSHWRHAGALAAALSDAIPEPATPADLELAAKRLRDRGFPIRWFVAQFTESGVGVEPVIAPAAFEHMMIVKLSLYGDDDLRAWLRTGRGPIRHAERLAQELPLPRTLAGLWTLLLERPRLAGAQAYVPQLVGALTLPPRRFVPEELPVGGYSDLVTRGEIEHLLPGQFALDEMEFLRRYSERELLYFRREEPPAQNRHELLVLLDQGVRTWGDVRLVLTAAALAFGKQAARHKTPFLLAATSNEGEIVHPLEIAAETLGELIEASDLSLHPGLALEQVLETPSEAMRDVVLLTHPRSLVENEVIAAARRLGGNDRLFAVTLDQHGLASVHEVRRGTPIKLRQFHVDFTPSTPKPRPQPIQEGTPAPAWTGAIEAIPFPFRLGTMGSISHFDFDYEGRHLLTVSGPGLLHVWSIDGQRCEMLPRAAPLFKTVLGVIGVKGGFVVVGSRGAGTRLVMAHYKLHVRQCQAWELVVVSGQVALHYNADRHVVALLNGRWSMLEINLHDHKLPVLDSSATIPPPPRLLPWNRFVPLIADPKTAAAQGGDPDPAEAIFDSRTGALILCRVEEGAVVSYGLEPHMNGKWCLRDATAESVQLAGRSLALQATRRDIGRSITVLRCPGGAVLREYPLRRNKHNINRHLLNYDGSRIALARSDHRIEVQSIEEGNGPSLRTRGGGSSRECTLCADRNGLLIGTGAGRRHWHFFHWGDGVLTQRHHRAPWSGMVENRTQATHHELPAICGHDPERFVAGCRSELWFVLDRFGQVAVLDRQEKLLAMFVTFRERWAAWLPDGTRMGSVSLSQGPPTPRAADIIGRTLRDATRGDTP